MSEELDLAEEWASCPKCAEIHGLCDEHRKDPDWIKENMKRMVKGEG